MAKISEKTDDQWRFRCYAPSGEGSGFDGWYSSLAAEVRAEIDACLELLRQSRSWDEPEFKPLNRGRKCVGLDEVRVDVGADAYRLIGFRGPSKGEFTILFGFKKVTTADYGPACVKAQARKEGVLKDGKRAPPCRFP